MRPGLAVSSIGHAVVLGWGLLTFAPLPLEPPLTEAMPIDLVPISDLTQLKAGKRNAPKQEEPKRIAEKIAEPKQAEPEKKANDKPEVKTAAAPPPPPPPEPKPEPKKEEVKPEPKPEPVSVPEPEPRKKPPPKTDTAKSYTPKQRNFEPDKIAALLDRREPRRERPAAEVPSPVAALGASTGNAPRLSQSEIDALRAQIQACWNPPIGAERAEELIVRLRIQFRVDGTLAAEPVLVNRGGSPYFQIATESAMRAVRRCAPYTMPAHKYDIWRDVEVTFDPRDMFGG